MKIQKKVGTFKARRQTIMIVVGIFIGVFLMSFVSSYCYQESADTFNQSGIDGVCGLQYNGSYIGGNANEYDGNWGTIYSGANSLYINYTKPYRSTNASFWMGGQRIAGTDGGVLFQIPTPCWNADNNVLSLRVDTGGSGVGWYCWNSSDYYQINFYNGFPVDAGLYEEAMNWSILSFENSQTYNNSTVSGMNEFFAMNMTYDNVNYNIVDAKLIYAGINYGGAITGTSDNVLVSKTISIPYTNSFIINNFYWSIGLKNSSGVFYINSSTQSQNVFNVQFDDCSTYTTMIYNITLYEQEGKTKLDNSSAINTTIETTTTISSVGTKNVVYNQSVLWTNTNPVRLCMNTNLSNYAYRLDSTIGYKATGYVSQFYYIDNANLSTSSSYNPTISLYALPSAQSTSFLVSYQDENYIYVKDAIIDVWRKYIGTGEFISVEQGKTDANGQTILHLITEDVVYKFLVWKDGVLQYESPEYVALCQATPCQINLKKPYQVQAGLSPFENIYFNLNFSSADRKITFTFTTIDGTSTAINMTTTKTSDGSVVCADYKVSNAGTIVCQVPIAYDNTTYLTEIYKDGKYLGYKTFSLEQTPQQVFGTTGILLTAIAFLTLALMGISSGVATIVFGIIGLVFAGLLGIFNSGNILGVGSSIIWIIIAGIIIIYKINERRAS